VAWEWGSGPALTPARLPPDDGAGTVLRPQVEAQGLEPLRVLLLSVARRGLAGAEHDRAAVKHPDAQRGDARDDRPDPGSRTRDSVTSLRMDVRVKQRSGRSYPDWDHRDGTQRQGSMLVRFTSSKGWEPKGIRSVSACLM